jgi:hypothetical protein
MRKTHLFEALFAAFLLAQPAIADEEAANRVHVKSSANGRYYAKSIPDADRGSKGKTLVYAVTKDKDKLIATYKWYAQEFFLLDAGPTIVQMGPWARGHEASKDDLAIAFYKDGKLLRSYSTLDIAGTKDNVSSSVSHYTVFESIQGYRWIISNNFAFDTRTNDGRAVSFDVHTGERLTKEDEENLKILEIVQEIKIAWWNQDPDRVRDVKTFKLSAQDLTQFAPTKFPRIPDGYDLIPGALFERPRLERRTSPKP